MQVESAHHAPTGRSRHELTGFGLFCRRPVRQSLTPHKIRQFLVGLARAVEGGEAVRSAQFKPDDELADRRRDTSEESHQAVCSRWVSHLSRGGETPMRGKLHRQKRPVSGDQDWSIARVLTRSRQFGCHFWCSSRAGGRSPRSFRRQPTIKAVAARAKPSSTNPLRVWPYRAMARLRTANPR